MYEEDFDKKIKATQYLVGANSFEQHSLWREYSNQSYWAENAPYLEKPLPKYKWIQDNPGMWEVIGSFHDMPVCISIAWNNIENISVAFYYMTSKFTHYDMLQEWLKRKFRNTPSSNAMNFHHCLNEIESINSKKE